MGCLPFFNPRLQALVIGLLDVGQKLQLFFDGHHVHPTSESTVKLYF